jgi:hypothetical protein
MLAFQKLIRSNRITTNLAAFARDALIAESWFAFMILAFHSIFSMYGFWMPNDPRDSGSNYVAQWDRFRYGPAMLTHSRQSVAATPHDHSKRLAATHSRRVPPVEVTGLQALAIVEGDLA